ncbi:hypothetical protein JOC55_006245 [Paenibacillus sacheonensis]|nr:hypothetical protein [Paenibacillus sacheonensis]
MDGWTNRHGSASVCVFAMNGTKKAAILGEDRGLFHINSA